MKPCRHRRLRLWAAPLLVGAVLLGCSPAPRVPAPPPVPTEPQPAVSVPVETRARHWDDYRLRAARRIVAANPQGVYLDRPPDVLLAIPVLAIDLNADGSVRRIEVLRYPGQARDTTQLAIDAVLRAAPFGSVAHLPRPWRFNETFLFRDDRRFKPRTLD
ncbi:MULTISPECIES: hypothetical protein [Caldimonas]|uniref:hypothetical protein n=1 Tax=Caldimonas TaxID=196013 RepID=UPI0003702CAB|nr:hypothetical protein [Caldimonas manganoxidans]GIX23718.1 MAG: hypothetical protein KatS3mg122_0949 [Caldimonas sp.]